MISQASRSFLASYSF